jgi:hypothetical protein
MQYRPAVIDQLILMLRSKVVLAHSVEAVRHLAQSSDELVEQQLAIQSVRWSGLPLTVILCRHLGYVSGLDEFGRICDAIVAALTYPSVI